MLAGRLSGRPGDEEGGLHSFSTVSAVPITPKPGTMLPAFPLDSVRCWFQIRRIFPGYRNHFSMMRRRPIPFPFTWGESEAGRCLLLGLHQPPLDRRHQAGEVGFTHVGCLAAHRPSGVAGSFGVVSGVKIIRRVGEVSLGPRVFAWLCAFLWWPPRDSNPEPMD